MNKSTPTKKKPIKAHRGRIVYEGRGGGRPIPPRPFPGRPQIPRPFPGRPMPRPMPFPPPRRGRRGPQIDPRRPRFAQPISKQERDMRRMIAERARQFQGNIIRQQGLQAQRVGNKGMAVTKKAIGENDFRKGGLTLSTVDNRKNK
tara:strand:- start:207 stop:644 length:438 start_codon:yes stop_codon:yes gene_type:complete